MTMTREPIVDFSGRIMFFCTACGAPMTRDDFFEIGLRLPDSGESHDDYCDAELIDGVMHVDCLRSARAG
jgi:hypothetical protein